MTSDGLIVDLSEKITEIVSNYRLEHPNIFQRLSIPLSLYSWKESFCPTPHPIPHQDKGGWTLRRRAL